VIAHLIVRSGKSEAEVIINKRLRCWSYLLTDTKRRARAAFLRHLNFLFILVM